MNAIGRFLAGCLLASVIGLAVPCDASDLSFGAGATRLGTEVRSLAEIRNQQVVRQRWDYSCGSAALSTVLSHHLDDPTPESAVVVSILRRTDPVRVRSRGGFSLLDLKHYLARRGYDSAGYTGLDVEELDAFAVPPIVPISLKGFDHFVVFRGYYGDRVVLADPAFGNITMRVERFSELWKSSIAFVIKDVEPADADTPLEVRTLPFSNQSQVYRLTTNSRFRRIKLQ